MITPGTPENENPTTSNGQSSDFTVQCRPIWVKMLMSSPAIFTPTTPLNRQSGTTRMIASGPRASTAGRDARKSVSDGCEVKA